MADETPGRVAATLAEIRERSEVAGKIMVSWKAQIQRARASANDVPFLLAAVEAALKHHRRIPDQRGVADGPPRPPICEGCRIAWPCPEVAAIGASLTGTQPSEDGDHG